MKKIIILFLMAFGLFGFQSLVIAHGDHDVSIDEVLQEIIQQQSIGVIQDVDCNVITDEQFESLGDAVIEQMHPGEQHELMDQMMGGEGSDSLKSMHINMGQNYLGCGNSSNMMGGSMMNMMGNSMMDQYSQGSMMSFPGLNVTSNWWLLCIITTILIWIILVLGIIALIKYIKK